MRVWLDTEFNGFQGDLISIGMIAEDGQFLYAVRNATQQMDIDPWVQENVIPFMGKAPHSDYIVLWEHDTSIKQRLEQFLMKYEDVNIIVDWPDDIQHLCKFMITGPGLMINTNKNMRLTFTLDRNLDGVSEVPHNAIFDAIGNMQATHDREYIDNNYDAIIKGLL